MLANGIGARQLATRSALYSVANEAMSALVVPGMPLGSDAPGAPAVEPPMADGHTGAAGATTGGGVGAICSVAGVVVKVRVGVDVLASVAPTVVVVAVDELDDDALVEPLAAEAEVAPLDPIEPVLSAAAGADVATEVGPSTLGAVEATADVEAVFANVSEFDADDADIEDPAP